MPRVQSGLGDGDAQPAARSGDQPYRLLARLTGLVTRSGGCGGLALLGHVMSLAASVEVAAAYSSSVTWAPQVALSSSHMARWLMKWSGRAPCQCSSPGGVWTVSPGRMTMTRSRVATTPMPSPGGAGARREPH